MSSHDASSPKGLDGHGIFAIVVFAVVALICIQPLRIPLPRIASDVIIKLKGKVVGSHATSQESAAHTSGSSDRARARLSIHLTHVWTPTIGILLLLATRTIGGEQIEVGIIGSNGVEPYDVLALFLGLAYIAISLDATGLLRYLAFQVCLKAGSSGYRLYLILFSFFWCLGVLVGNDPVILSGTAFLVHLTRVAGISPPSAWIWAQFVAANISSAVLVSSNPTNLVIATGFDITFPVYTAYMILPSFASALVSLLVLLLFFRNRTLSRRGKTVRPGSGTVGLVKAWMKQPSLPALLRPRKPDRSRSPPVFGNNSIAMSAMAASNGDAGERTMIKDKTEKEKPPLIYIPPTIVRPDVVARAALIDSKGAMFSSFIMAATLVTLIVTSIFGDVKVYMVAAPGACACLVRDIAYDAYTWRKTRKEELIKRDAEERHRSIADEAVAANADNIKQQQAVSSPSISVLSAVNKFTTVLPTVSYVLARLPLPLLPFAFGMFILVESLAHVGFIDVMANGLGKVCANSAIGCAIFMSFLSVVLCNLGGTNIGATILLTRALQSEYFQSHLVSTQAELITKIAYFSVAFGSNVGALGGTFAASLAGLLWRDALLQRGIVVTKMQFLLWCSVVIVPATLSGVLIIYAEVQHFHHVG